MVAYRKPRHRKLDNPGSAPRTKVWHVAEGGEVESQAQEHELDREPWMAQLLPAQQAWLKRNWAQAKRHFHHLPAIEQAVRAQGYSPEHPAYFAAIEGALNHLDAAQQPAGNFASGGRVPMPQTPPAYEQRQPTQEPKMPVYSAPPSRTVPGYTPSDQKITLTPAQREVARFSGISDVEYARYLMKQQRGDESQSFGVGPQGYVIKPMQGVKE